MSIITFLKKRYKEYLLKRVDELKKLSDSYFESAQSSKEMIELISKQLFPYQTLHYFCMHYNPFLFDAPTPINVFHMYHGNFFYYSSLHNSTKLKVERLEKRIEKL